MGVKDTAHEPDMACRALSSSPHCCPGVSDWTCMLDSVCPELAPMPQAACTSCHTLHVAHGISLGCVLQAVHMLQAVYGACLWA